MSNHTPGPWSIDPQYLSEVQTPDMLTIASCWHKHAVDQEITITGVLPCSLEESAANARLISAAPDLFTALNCVPTDVDYGSYDEFVSALGHWWSEMALPAIKKAKGKS